MAIRGRKLLLNLSCVSIILMIVSFSGIIFYTVRLGDRNKISDIFVVISALNTIPFVASLIFVAFQYPRIPSKFGAYYKNHQIISLVAIVFIDFLIAYPLIKLLR